MRTRTQEKKLIVRPPTSGKVHRQGYVNIYLKFYDIYITSRIYRETRPDSSIHHHIGFVVTILTSFETTAFEVETMPSKDEG